MPRGSQLVLGHAVRAPPVRDGPDGIADSGRDGQNSPLISARFALSCIDRGSRDFVQFSSRGI
jgi:hypothetical protein